MTSRRFGLGAAVLFLFVGLLALPLGCAGPPVNPGEKTTSEESSHVDGGTDKVGGACSHQCDCAQGQECIQGKCANPAPGAIPLYCCTKPGCVPGAKCIHPDSRQDTCSTTKPQCITSADCGQPSCKNNGNDCEEQIPDCIAGKCVNLPKPVKSAVCDASQGVCTPRAPTCKGHCDCAQGQFCNQGTCEVSASPVYCCSKPGCPANANCYEKDGSIGSCQGNNKCTKHEDCGPTRCSQQGDQCTELQATCEADGSCKSSSRTITGRCGANGKCVSEQKCTTHCDCPQSVTCLQGQCVPLSSRATFCCDKAGCPDGKACYKKDGSPDVCGTPKVCRQDSDCGKPACKNSGTSTCVEEFPFCDTRSGQCSVRSQSKPGHTCGSKGICEQIPLPSCKVHCDCPQGLACLQGQCSPTSSGTPVYCCDKAGCPQGKPCIDKADQKGTCGGTPNQCRSDADCGGPTCSNNGNDCVEKQPKCDPATKQCVTATEKKVANASCDAASGACKTKPCTNHCDCQQGYFCWQGVCQRSSYEYYCCDNAGCPAGASCITRGGQTDYCPIACKSVCDCPAGQDCVSGRCKQGTAPVYCCDDPQQCPAGASCKDKSDKAGTCPAKPRPCKTVCDCVQGEACTNGTCQKSSTPEYCCDKPGCVEGKGCVSKANLSGICPKSCKTHCDCDQGAACIQGLCQRSPLFGDIYCCSKPGCPLGQYCYEPNGQYGRCPQKRCTSPCDCSQGEDCRSGICIATQPPVYCCDQGGCPSGAACKDKSNKWGTCKAQASCKSPCDCNQGEDCYQGQCVGVFPAVYCCDNVGCPVGQTCYDKNNKASTCQGAPCKTACDCPVQGQSCVRGSCAYLLGSARVYCCDKPFCPAGNKCEDKQGTLKTCSQQACKTPCDCNQGEDCRNGQCVLVSPAVYCCSKLGCPQGYACYTSTGSQATCR